MVSVWWYRASVAREMEEVAETLRSIGIEPIMAEAQTLDTAC
jgi:hypothetical protein